MNCDWAKANITFYVYDELADDARYELEQHVERCPDCAAELGAMCGFKSAVSAVAMHEPAPNLLAASRMRLQEALESAEPNRSWLRWVLEPASWFRQIRLAPAAAALLFLFGFGAGIGTTYRIVSTGTAKVEPTHPPALTEASILGIRGVTQQPGSSQVDVKYDTIVPQTVTGSADDPRIQQLLIFAARNNANSGVRVDSVDVLAQKPDDELTRRALVYSLKYDSNPGVRLKALEGLGTFVKSDATVREAVLTALVSDSNPGVRTEAIQLLKPACADGGVRQVLEQLAEQDQNTSIRSLSRSVLNGAPHFD